MRESSVYRSYLDLVVSKEEDRVEAVDPSLPHELPQVIPPFSLGVVLGDLNVEQFIHSHEGSKSGCTRSATPTDT